jgi:hypothetical protein
MCYDVSNYHVLSSRNLMSLFSTLSNVQQVVCAKNNNILTSTIFSKTLACVLPSIREGKFRTHNEQHANYRPLYFNLTVPR